MNVSKGSGYLLFLIFTAAVLSLTVGMTFVLLNRKATAKADLEGLQARYYAQGGLLFIGKVSENYQVQASFGGFRLSKKNNKWQSLGYYGSDPDKPKAVVICYEP